MTWLKPSVLSGIHARLEPLSHDHRDALIDAVEDGQIWRLWYTNVPSPAEMTTEIDRRLSLQAAGSMLPFTIFDKATGKAAGMTTYMNVDAIHKRVEIGSTWYRASAQRTALNTDCKLILLTHAFDTLACIAVEFRTHFFNAQSRLGIERLGAKLDGVLRNHQRARDGTLRDTVVYSIIAAEWPTVRSHLQWQLTRPRANSATQ